MKCRILICNMCFQIGYLFTPFLRASSIISSFLFITVSFCSMILIRASWCSFRSSRSSFSPLRRFFSIQTLNAPRATVIIPNAPYCPAMCVKSVVPTKSTLVAILAIIKEVTGNKGMFIGAVIVLKVKMLCAA